MATDSLDALTPREREILTLIAEGHSLAEIAQNLSRSLKTVESHRLSLGRKLRASNRVELAKIAIANGLISVGPAQANPPDSNLSLKHDLINQINLAIKQATGRELLNRFCKAASKLPEIDIAAICTSEHDTTTGACNLYSRVIMAVSDNGRLSKPTRYNAMKTPCQHVIEQGIVSIERGIREQYPHDPWLQEIEAESYLGVLFTNDEGESVGGVGLISRDPLDNLDIYRHVIDFFAPRLAGAIQVCAELETLRSENDRLQASLLEPLVSPLEHTDDSPQASFATAVHNIRHQTDALAGPQFLSGFLEAICQEYGLAAGGVCSLDQSRSSPTLYTVAFCVDGQTADPIQYEAKNSPCEVVIEESGLCVPHLVTEHFPDDQMLQDFNFHSYCGRRLPGPGGKTAGVLWVLHTEPLPDPNGVESLLKYYAPRVGTELSNFIQLEMLMQERERLEGLLAKQA